MHINNPDALKTWLTEVLEPLCDADPAALARYVLALLKKDKPEKDLRDCMKEQLDVFLGAETEPFLEQLFRSIKSEEYIKVVQAKEAAAAATAAAMAAATAQQASPAAAPTTTTTTTTTATEQVSSNSTHSTNSTSSSKVRIKREFTPPLHESKPSKDSLAAAGVPSGATTVSSSSSSHENNGSELSSSASSGAISAATPNLASAVPAKSTPPVKSSSKEDHVSKVSILNRVNLFALPHAPCRRSNYAQKNYHPTTNTDSRRRLHTLHDEGDAFFFICLSIFIVTGAMRWAGGGSMLGGGRVARAKLLNWLSVVVVVGR